jgi:hypothetical protein
MTSNCPCRRGEGGGKPKAYSALGSAMKRAAMGCALADGVVGLLATTVLDAEIVHPTSPRRMSSAERHMFVIISCKHCSALGLADVMS